MTRILVVDDDEGSAHGLAQLLRLDGFDVVALESSVVAMDRVTRERFDVVVTDLEMPEVHGLEVIRAVRARTPSVPIFVMTAYGGSPAAQTALEQGARFVLDKPVDYDEMLGRIRTSIEASAPASA